jgi:diguanylate cyclase (GGDEF)-like protein
LKDKNVVKDKKGNWYLFVNLVLIVALLIGIWTKTSAWEAKFEVGNLILFIIIVNTILLFKDFILVSYPSKKGRRIRKLKSLASLRAYVNSTTTVDDKTLAASIEKLKEISECEYLEITILDKAQSTLLGSAGQQPQTLAGTRFVYNEGVLSIKHTGQLGIEEICKISDNFKPVKFKSNLTRLRVALVPLNLSNARLGICLFYNSKAPFMPKIALNNTGFFLESLISLVENSKNQVGGYKDKATGLILYKNYEELVDNELERSERYEQEMSLLTIKITDFDKLQDSEKPLISKNIASAMKQSLRRFDLMFYGKEPGSYYALLTESGVEEAEGIARRLQKEFNKLIKKLQLSTENKLTLVIGSATYQTDATHSVGLIEKSADACATAIENKIDFKAFSITQKQNKKTESKK